MNKTLSCQEINPSSDAEATLIWLHGLGATNDDFVPLAADLQIHAGLPLRFVFPQAPSMPVSINNGMVMPAWYDISSLAMDARQVDHAGISRAVKMIEALITQEMERGFKIEQIFLAGFSQGAVVALSAMLELKQALGGVIALSGYLPLAQVPKATLKTPVFMGHGLEDEVVPYLLGQMAYEVLEKADYPVTACAYRMMHQVCEEEVGDIAEWLQEVV